MSYGTFLTQMSKHPWSQQLMWPLPDDHSVLRIWWFYYSKAPSIVSQDYIWYLNSVPSPRLCLCVLDSTLSFGFMWNIPSSIELLFISCIPLILYILTRSEVPKLIYLTIPFIENKFLSITPGRLPSLSKQLKIPTDCTQAYYFSSIFKCTFKCTWGQYLPFSETLSFSVFYPLIWLANLVTS